jgi:hypothetical protein
VQIAGAAHAHRAVHLGFRVAQSGDGGRGDVRDLVRHRDQRQVLALPEGGAGVFADRLCGGRACGRGSGPGALHAGVHVGLVVVVDVENVVAALEHAGQTAESDVHGAAVSALPGTGGFDGLAVGSVALRMVATAAHHPLGEAADFEFRAAEVRETGLRVVQAWVFLPSPYLHECWW